MSDVIIAFALVLVVAAMFSRELSEIIRAFRGKK